MAVKDGDRVLTVHLSPEDQERLERVKAKRQQKYKGKTENDSELVRNLIREEESIL